MHDNTRAHIACICHECLIGNKVQVVDGPPYSPDLNLIEHRLDNLDCRVQRPVPLLVTVADLCTALMEEWEPIPVAKLNALIDSTPSPVQVLIDANDRHIRD